MDIPIIIWISYLLGSLPDEISLLTHERRLARGSKLPKVSMQAAAERAVGFLECFGNVVKVFCQYLELPLYLLHVLRHFRYSDIP
ncbi:hypothetical protein TNCV_1015301 [Trichonephila clavipes]|uniref:Uncharacterized protein n=1 Tax=Trichonephila clavipes TaxID=2585209 RepID=A0A8X7B9T4_TRICX|nr:hypothetical protein TNCV_1015301 [Trichonephila clavipes]